MADFGTLLAPGVVRFERLLPGPIERVWAHLTEPEKRARWLAGGETQLHVGGRVELCFRHADLSPIAAPTPERFAASTEVSSVSGTVTACEPPHRLAFTWGEGGDRWSEVTFELEAVGDGMRLTVTHRLLGDEPPVWVGGRWAIVRRDGEDTYVMEGEYLEVEPPHRLRYTMGMPQFSPNRDTISVEITAEGGVVVFEQSGVDIASERREVAPGERSASEAGWQQGFDLMEAAWR